MARCAVVLLLLAATSPFALATARAADVNVTLPDVTAPPGGVAQVPIVLDRTLEGLGVIALEVRVPLDPAGIAGATWMPWGLVETWGTPFSNTTPTLAAIAAAGIEPIASPQTTLAVLRITVAPGVAPGTDLPLDLSVCRLNAGSPSTAVVPGVLRVRSGVGVPAAATADPRIAVFPNPVAGAARIAFSVPAGAAGTATLAVFAADGRRVRTLAAGGPGAREVRWAGDDDRGRPLPAGIYWVRLAAAGRVATCRAAIVR